MGALNRDQVAEILAGDADAHRRRIDELCEQVGLPVRETDRFDRRTKQQREDHDRRRRCIVGREAC